MVAHASGTFEVVLNAQSPEPGTEPAKLARMTIDKRFHGELDAVSQGQMLSVTTDVKGSAGYVAMERVNGALQGRRGTFALQHSGTMNRGAAQLQVAVVADSGTGQLVGLAGTMAIDIADGKHAYRFDYTLPDAP